MIMLSLVILSMATLVPHFCEARRYPHRHSVMKDVGFIDPVIPSCRPGDTLDEKMAGIEWKFGRCNKEVDNVYYKRRSRKCKDEPDDKCIPKPGTGVLGLGGPVSPESSGKDCDVLQEQSILSACDCSEMKPLEWGAWTCVSEYRHRSRRCGLKEGTDKCSYKRCDGKSLKEETIDCDFCGKTRNWEAWGEWGDCDLKGYRHRSRTCEYNDPELKCDDKHNCKSDESRQKKFFPTCCRERNWESWGPWGKCDSEGYIHRQRKCEPKDPESECDKSTCQEGEDGEKKRNIEKCCAPREFTLTKKSCEEHPTTGRWLDTSYYACVEPEDAICIRDGECSKGQTKVEYGERCIPDPTKACEKCAAKARDYGERKGLPNFAGLACRLDTYETCKMARNKYGPGPKPGEENYPSGGWWMIQCDGIGWCKPCAERNLVYVHRCGQCERSQDAPCTGAAARFKKKGDGRGSAPEEEGIMSDEHDVINHRRHPQFELNELDEEQGVMWENK